MFQIITVVVIIAAAVTAAAADDVQFNSIVVGFSSLHLQ